MRGKVDKCASNRPGYFFIIGEDGIRYFGHRHQCVNNSNYKFYGYKGNTLTFDPGDPPKQGAMPTADNIIFDKNDRIEKIRQELKEEMGIVRCKDCIHYKHRTCYNEVIPVQRTKDWYCAGAVRK